RGGLGQAEVRQLQHQDAEVRWLGLISSGTNHQQQGKAAFRRLPPLARRGLPVLNRSLRRAFALAGFCLLLVIGALPAAAGPVEDAIAKFANDSYSDTGDAICALVASGDARALPIISALKDGRLVADGAAKKVYIKGADGKVADAATGEAADASF